MASLLDARLTVPRSRFQLVERPRLLNLLDDAILRHSVTLVTGGAGSGKTLAVAGWALQSDWPVAWVSVDANISGPVRLWNALVVSLSRALDSDLSRLASFPVVDRDLVESVAAGIGDRQVALVLDDVHELDQGSAWEGLEHLMRVAPRGLRLVLVSRHDPPIALQRLRLAGELGDVRAADLAFTAQEARLLLAGGQVVLGGRELDKLMETTEGWAAGLRLALMTLEDAADSALAVAGFSGRQGMVAGYLMEEVLRHLAPDQRNFLLRTAVTERTCGPLAAELTGDNAALRALQQLARRNSLVVDLEGSGWFRYHPLMLQMLRSRLHAEHPELERELHTRASLWFETRREWLLSLEHAIKSGDWDLAARVALRSGAVLLFTPFFPQLAGLLARLPIEASHGRPLVEAALALAAYCRGDSAAFSALAAKARVGLNALPEPDRGLVVLNLLVLEAVLERRAGDADAMVRCAQEALSVSESLKQEQAPGWASVRGAVHGLAGIAELWCGRPARAQKLLIDAIARARVSDLETYGLVYHQGFVAMTELALGDVAAAERRARAAIRETELGGGTFRSEAAAVYLALGGVELQRGRPDEASRALESCLRHAAKGSGDPFLLVYVRGFAARSALLAGDMTALRRNLAEMERQLAARPQMRLPRLLHAELLVEAELAAGAPSLAQAALDRATRAVASEAGAADRLATARAAVLLAQGHADAVRGALAGRLQAEDGHPADWLLLALAEDRLRRDAAATEALAHAVELAAAQEIRYPFLRAPARLAELLRRHLEVVGKHRGFVESLLAELPASPVIEPQPQLEGVNEALTDRELSVLVYLPTMSSNAEIAERLGISVNTVKQHLKSINRKLGVGSRREAVRVALARGLLAERELT